MLMLLCVHVTSVLFLVLVGNFALLLELHALTLVARSYGLLDLSIINHTVSCSQLGATDITLAW